MSRFADPRATRTVDLGPCECLGTPHDNDWVKVRTEFTSAEVVAFRNSSPETEAEATEIFQGLVTEWNLLGSDGQPCQPTAEALAALNALSLQVIAAAATESIIAAGTVPNASSGPSREQSPETASLTPTTQPGT